MSLRILHVIDTGGAGGAESVLLNIVRDLDTDRFHSRVVPPGEGWLHERLSDAGLDVSVVPRGPSPDLGFLAGLRKEIRSFRPHLIHTHLLTSSVYGSVAAALESDVPLAATFHGTPDVSEADRFLFVKARILGRRANRLVFVAEHLRTKLSRRLGVPEERTEVIENGLRLPDIREAGHAEPGRPLLIGAVGNLRPAKDYPTLLRAARLVLERHPHVSFGIAGGGREEEMSRLRALGEELGLSGSVRFEGFVDDVRGFMSGLDIFVSSSATEGLPLAIVEAAALGTPVCATRSGGAEAVLEPAGARLLSPCGDSSALADRLSWTIENLAEARETAARVARDVRARFAVARMIERYSDLYERMVRRA